MTTPPPQEAQAAIAEAERLKPFSAPLAFFNSQDQIVRSATALLVYTGAKYLAITCEHVVRCFETLHAGDRGHWLAICGVGPSNAVLKIDPRPLARSQQRDLATFEFLRSEQVTEIGRQFSTIWPPVSPVLGQQIISIGYPSSLVSQTGNLVQVMVNIFKARYYLG